MKGFAALKNWQKLKTFLQKKLTGLLYIWPLNKDSEYPENNCFINSAVICFELIELQKFLSTLLASVLIVVGININDI